MDKREVKRLREQRAGFVAELETIVSTAANEAREFTAEEAEKRGSLTAKIEAADDQIRKAEKDAKRARKQEKAAEARTSFGYGASSNGIVKVGHEPRVYERGNGQSYLYDLVCLGAGPGITQFAAAYERIQRHRQENLVEASAIDQRMAASRKPEEAYFLRQMVEAMNQREDNRGSREFRALSTASGAGGEFVPPLYLTADWLEYARAGRVVADACHKEKLPDGTMSINIPKVTGGTSAATQGTQNTAVSDTDLTTAYVTVPVYTKAGQQVVSLQLLERSPVEFDQVVFKDLGLALAQNVDVAVVNGSGTNDVTGILNTSGINSVTWTTSTPSVKGLYGQIEQAKVDIATARYLPATHAFMTPSRWGWIEQTFDSQNRPIVVPAQNGPFNAVQEAPAMAVAQGATGGRLLSLDVFQDANIPANLGTGTNQDAVLIAHMDDNWLFESPIVTRALPQTYGQNLSVLLQVYEYIAFTAARYPVSNSVITGTGLTPATYNS